MKSFGTPGPQRDPGYPDVPTLDEQGLKGFDATINYLIVAPKGMPKPIVDRLNAAINAATSSEAFATKLKAVGGVRVLKNMSPAQTATWLAQDDERYYKLVKDQNIALE